MTTLSTRTDQQGTGLRGLLGATALTLFVVGAAAVWLARPSGDASTATDSGLDMAARASAPAIAPAQYPESATSNTVPLDMPTLTDGAGRYLTEPRVSAARATTSGLPVLDGAPGMVAAGPVAEPVSDQAMYQRWQQHASAEAGAHGGAGGVCDPTIGPADC